MGAEIKTMEWSVQNYLIEKIYYNTKVRFSHLLPAIPLLLHFWQHGSVQGSVGSSARFSPRAQDIPMNNKWSWLLWGRGSKGSTARAAWQVWSD
jgi:hypothetical protein